MVIMAQCTSPYKPKMSRLTFCPPSETSADSDIEDQEEMTELSNNKYCSSDKAIVVVRDIDTTDQEDEGTIDVEESLSYGFDPDMEAENYYKLSTIAMTLDMVVKFPDVEEINYETSCGRCLDDSGPFIISCANGHALCSPCFETADTDICEVEIWDSPSCKVKCGAMFYEIDDAIMNTPYYINFMQALKNEPSVQKLECSDVVKPVEDIIQQDEPNDCAFRLIKYCGFRTEEDCQATFECLEANLMHLMEKHNFPVNFCSQARFMIRYGRKEYQGDQVRPLIRGAVETNGKNYLGLLVAADLEGNKTRLWFVNANKDIRLNCLSATIRIYPPTRTNGQMKIDWLQRNSTATELAVVPEIMDMFRLKSTKTGLPYYVDFDNKKLDKKFCVKKDGKKYFGATVVLPENDQRPKSAN